MEILLSCLALFFISIGGAKMLSTIIGRGSIEKIVESNKTNTQKDSVFLKKYKQVDVERWRTTNRLIGLVLALAFLLVSVESFTKKESTLIEPKRLNPVDTALVWIDTPKDIYIPPPPKVEVPPPPKPPTIEKIKPLKEPLDDIPEIKREEKIEIPVPKIPVAVPTIKSKPPTIKTPPPPKIVKKEEDKLADIIHEWASQPPVFEGGEDELRRQIQNEFDIPRKYKNSGEKGGTITTRFVVLEDGNIGQIKILKGITNCETCNEEAIRAIKSIHGKFTPGKQAGKPVKVWFTLPIVVKIR